MLIQYSRSLQTREGPLALLRVTPDGLDFMIGELERLREMPRDIPHRIEYPEDVAVWRVFLDRVEVVSEPPLAASAEPADRFEWWIKIFLWLGSGVRVCLVGLAIYGLVRLFGDAAGGS